MNEKFEVRVKYRGGELPYTWHLVKAIGESGKFLAIIDGYADSVKQARRYAVRALSLIHI